MSENLTIKWNEQGLVPAIVQDAHTRQVLMMAWMNEEALNLTFETDLVHFWSRSRQELWKKGATSGSLMHVVSANLDCDGDTLLVSVNVDGPACHTGNVTCFHGSMRPTDELKKTQQSQSVIEDLFAIIQQRKQDPQPGSYTNHLLESGEEEILKKIGEESVEVILAAVQQGDERLISELADLVYHGLVLLAARDLTLQDVGQVLTERKRP